MKKFRLLRADEIDCRVAVVKKTGISLLLYKDARCDMNILDETVGPFNWQKTLICIQEGSPVLEHQRTLKKVKMKNICKGQYST